VNAGDALLNIDTTDYLIKLEQANASKMQAEAAYEQANAGYEQALAGKEKALAGEQQANAGKQQADAAYEQANAAYEQANAVYNQANAAYEGAVASYNSVINGTAEQTKLQLKSVLDAAEIEYNNAKQNYDNQKVLYEKGSISKTAFDAAETRFKNAEISYNTAKSNYDLALDVILEENKVNAQSGVNSAEAALNSAQAGITSAQAALNSAKAGVSNADAALSSAKAGVSSAEAAVSSALAGVESAKAMLDSAESAVEAAQNALNDTLVCAPISGYIAAKNINKGQMVSPGIEIYSIKATDSVEAQIDVTEAVIADISIGTKASINVKAAEKENLNGVVTKINPVKDARTGMYQVSINIENKDNTLKEGMFADIRLTLSDSENALVIPSEAIMEDKDGSKFVYVANDDKAVRADIELGIVNDEVTEVISGISDGDQIIVSGKEYLSEKNNKIRIVE